MAVGFGGVETITEPGDLNEPAGAGGVDAEGLVLLRVGDVVVEDLRDFVAGELDGDQELIEGARTLQQVDDIDLALGDRQTAVLREMAMVSVPSKLAFLDRDEPSMAAHFHGCRDGIAQPAPACRISLIYEERPEGT